MTSMAEGWCGKTLVDVKVSVRPLKGYWLSPEKSSTTLEDGQETQEVSRTTTKSTSAVSMATTQEVVYKRDGDPAKLKCHWKADSTESFFQRPPPPPKPVTPPKKLESASKKGWRKALGPTNKPKASPAGWQPALSSRETSPTVSRLSTRSRATLGSTTASSSKNCRCRCREKRRTRKGRDDSAKSRKSGEETKTLKKEDKKEEPKKTVFRSPVAAVLKNSSEEVAVEPAVRRPEEKVPYYILWELKAWAVLFLFWLLLFVFRYSTVAP